MTEVFIRALDRLSDPVAIIALLLMVTVVLLVKSVLRHLPEINKTLGSLVTIIEHLVYNHRGDDDETH